jgi:hypothetical protein
MKIKAIYLLVLLFAIITCSKDEDNTNKNDDFEPMSGFSETCKALSTEGLEVKIDGNIFEDIDPIGEEYQDYLECVIACNDSDLECFTNCISLLSTVPAGGAFGLSLTITNITLIEITFTVEPGDWFDPGSGDYQPMMTPINISVEIKPGETETIIIPVYCLARDLSAPDESMDYSWCEAVNNNTCLAEIIAILKTKDVGAFTFTQSDEVQSIIWNCTEGEEVDWDYLNKLPDK